MEQFVENSKILAELVRLYPQDAMKNIIGILEMPIIDRNNAVWYAIDNGWIEDNGREFEKPMVTTQTKAYVPQEVDDLKIVIKYTVMRVALADEDMSEDLLTQWLAGYKSHFVAIALKQMLESQELFSYTLTDDEGLDKESEYTFYTLPRNKGKEFGRKQFKRQHAIKLKPDSTKH